MLVWDVEGPDRVAVVTCAIVGNVKCGQKTCSCNRNLHQSLQSTDERSRNVLFFPGVQTAAGGGGGDSFHRNKLQLLLWLYASGIPSSGSGD
jgi:hypothetical protein